MLSDSIRIRKPEAVFVNCAIGAMSDLAASTVGWSVWSRRTASFHQITGGWIADETDVVRRRRLKATTRSVWPQVVVSVYSKRLFELDFPLATGSTVFTAPAGFTTVIRCISGWIVWSTSTGFAGLYDAATGNEGWVAVGRSPVRDAVLSNFRWVLNAGDVLKFESDGVAGGSIQVSGYVLAQGSAGLQHHRERKGWIVAQVAPSTDRHIRRRRQIGGSHVHLVDEALGGSWHRRPGGGGPVYRQPVGVTSGRITRKGRRTSRRARTGRAPT